MNELSSPNATTSSVIAIYQTNRLLIKEVFAETCCEALLQSIVAILTPEVVDNLPPYFHGVNNKNEALTWLNRITQEGRLFAVTHQADNVIIGFLFTNTAATDVHIGYLLQSDYWRQGLAFELLNGFIPFARAQSGWQCLLAGVEPDNIASAHLLMKLGFQRLADDSCTDFYRYRLG